MFTNMLTNIQPGSLVLYGDDKTCVARVSEITDQHEVVFKDDVQKSSATIPASCVQYVFNQLCVPKIISDNMRNDTDFFPRRLSVEEAEDFIRHNAASVIQRRLIKYFYTPPYGSMYIKLASKNHAWGEQCTALRGAP